MINIFSFKNFNKIFKIFLPKFKFKLVISQSHQVLLTADFQVYSWGDNTYGQLGLNDRLNRLEPTLIDELNNKNITHIAIGIKFF